MWEAILFFAEGLTAAELGAYSPGFIPVPGSILVLYEGDGHGNRHSAIPKSYFSLLTIAKAG